MRLLVEWQRLTTSLALQPRKFLLVLAKSWQGCLWCRPLPSHQVDKGKCKQEDKPA